MKLGELCSREVVTLEAGASLREAALAMRNSHVGALVVTERARPVGLLTDRDIVVSVVAVAGARPEGIRVGDAMSQPLVCGREDDGIFEAIALLRDKAVRRLPVLARDGTLAGIVTLDDLLKVIAAELGNLAEALRWERKRELAARASL